MTTADLLLRRLQAQHLLSPGTNPAGILCGFQAQFLRNAVHALRLRSEHVTLDGLCKTWTLRGTVHLIPECDLPLYIRHCGPAEDVCESGWYLWTASRGQANPPEIERHYARLAVEAIASGIDEREALRAHLHSCGMSADEEARLFNPWGGLIAELANIGCIAFAVNIADGSRPDETKRYRLLPPFTPLTEDAARLEMARRYFTHYGPATLRDAAYFLHWTQAEVKAQLALLPAEHADIGGRTHFWLPSGEPVDDLPPCLLLAGFDPLMLGYRKEDNPALPPEHLRGIFSLAGIVHPGILLHGRIVGKWQEKHGKVTLTAFEALSPADKRVIEHEASRLFIPRTLHWT
jgi:hypothetical protein